MTIPDLQWMNKSLVGSVIAYNHIRMPELNATFLITEVRINSLLKEKLIFPYEVYICSLNENEPLQKEPVTEREILNLIQYGKCTTEGGTWTKIF
jgi:hypothetical protein